MSTISKSEKESIRKKTALPMLALAIGSMVMLFAGLTSAIVVRKAEGNWLLFDMPRAFYISTAVILISSLTMNNALQMIKKGLYKKATLQLIATFIFGISFACTQISGWYALNSQNVYFTGRTANAAGSFFYMLTWLHLMHMVGGLISLLVTAYNASKQKYSPENYLGVRLTAMFWHFLGILWVYLFLFLLYANK
jgi:cytochrome c oxidase subunit III